MTMSKSSTTTKLKRVDKYRHLYSPQLRRKDFLCFGEPGYIYQSVDGETEDVTQALTDILGRPIVLRQSGKSTPVDHHKPLGLSFNPDDPTTRLKTFEARNSFAGAQMLPNPHMDALQAVKYANDSANALINKINSLTPPPSHE